MLAAWELGIGSVPATVYEHDLARRLLGYPDDQFCEYLISFGYPADLLGEGRIVARGDGPRGEGGSTVGPLGRPPSTRSVRAYDAGRRAWRAAL